MRKSVAMLLVAGLLLCLFGCGSKSVQAASGVWVSYREDAGSVKSEDDTEIFVYSYQQPVLQGSAPGIHMINTKLDNATTAFVYGWMMWWPASDTKTTPSMGAFTAIHMSTA